MFILFFIEKKMIIVSSILSLMCPNKHKRRVPMPLRYGGLCRIYKAYIMPHLEYCRPLLLGVGRGQVKKLEDTNNYILRSILGYGKNTSCNHLLNMAGIRTLEERIIFQALGRPYKPRPKVRRSTFFKI